jgi:dTDP-4-amino-4,6-dideoxygalactose transaminase
MSTAAVQVPFFSGRRSAARERDAVETRVRGWLEGGDDPLAELASRLSALTGSRHIVPVGSASDALIVLLRAAGVGPGDEVVVPAYTFFASASSVIHVGAEPVFVDVEPETYAIDPDAATRAFTRATKAIMPVHLFTQMADLPRICAAAQEHGVLVLEDSAEAIGMRLGERHAGTFGLGGVLSFFPTKTLAAIGDAGAVMTDDDALAERARLLASRGVTHDGDHLEIGYDTRCDPLQAAVLLCRLDRLDADIARRAEIAARYDARLRELEPHVAVPTLRATEPPCTYVYYVYSIECDRRDDLVAHLDRRGVGTETYYPWPLTEQPCLRGRPGVRFEVPVSKRLSERAVGLPMYPDLSDEDVEHVCDAIADFYETS